MKKTTVLLLLCGSMLVPTPARADDGGFWDMLFHWHTKFSGYGTDFHLVCLTEKGKRIKGCEEWFTKFRHLLHPSQAVHTMQADGMPLKAFEEIKHEFNIRTTYFHSYGQTIPTALLAPGETAPGRVHAFKVMGMYYYRVGRHLDLGGGAGVLPVFGDGIQPFWRGIASGSAVLSPGGIWYVRAEVSYLTGRITGADWGAPRSTFALKPQPNASFAIGIDFRRQGIYQ